MSDFHYTQIFNILPELTLIVSAMIILLLSVNKTHKTAIQYLKTTRIPVILSILLIISITPSNNEPIFNSLFVNNDFTSFCKILILLSTWLALFLSQGYYTQNKQQLVAEYPVFILIAATGMMLMVSSNSILSLYMGLEMQSLSLYILAAINRDNNKSSEAGLKYFVLGALSSGIILYGCSLIYGFSGTIHFNALQNLYTNNDIPIGVITGLVFVIAGICFKISAVPFHMWTPDVYEGSPMPVTAFFATAPKIAATALCIRLLYHPFSDIVQHWQQIIIFISAASMIIGALGAIRQTNIKRLLAYSAIGHIGYILIGIATASEEGINAVLLYLSIYITLSIGIFALIMLINRKEGNSEDISTLSGLAKSNPIFAFLIAIIMFSMAGIPPFAGFFGKFFIFYAAIQQELYILSIIGLLTSVLAAFYYLKIIKTMYFDEATVPLNKNSQTELKYIAYTTAAFNLFFLFGFMPIMYVTGNAAQGLF